MFLRWRKVSGTGSGLNKKKHRVDILQRIGIDLRPFSSEKLVSKSRSLSMMLQYLLSFALLLSVMVVHSRDIVVLHHPEQPIAEKEALVVLSGLGAAIQGQKDQKKYFSTLEQYDLFIPDYISRKDIEQSAENIDRFFKKHKLSEYKRVHIVAYIVGSWSINVWLEQNPVHNIVTIIYDRSPYQERAPYVLVEKYPRLSRLALGKMLKKFTKMPYPTYRPPAGVQVGIMVESKPTKLIKRNKKIALRPGPFRWDFEQFEQPHQDAIYIQVDHDEMYHRFDVIGPEIEYFIQYGKFSKTAKRVPDAVVPL